MIVWHLFWALFLIALGFFVILGGVALVIIHFTGPSEVAEYQEEHP